MLPVFRLSPSVRGGWCSAVQESPRMVVEGPVYTCLHVSSRALHQIRHVAHYLLNPKWEHLFLSFAVPSTLSDLNL